MTCSDICFWIKRLSATVSNNACTWKKMRLWSFFFDKTMYPYHQFFFFYEYKLNLMYSVHSFHLTPKHIIHICPHPRMTGWAKSVTILHIRTHTQTIRPVEKICKDANCQLDQTRPSPKVSTTSLRQWGFRQCLPFSRTTLRGKHCRHPIAVMGVVDTYVQAKPAFKF